METNFEIGDVVLYKDDGYICVGVIRSVRFDEDMDLVYDISHKLNANNYMVTVVEEDILDALSTLDVKNIKSQYGENIQSK